MGRWKIDDALAKQAAAAAGSSLDAELDELALALHRWIPTGSTAKADAVAAGELPPGLDPAAVVEDLLAGSHHAWTCWPGATIVAAVLDAAGHDAEVVAELRTDPGSPPVDVHAAVVVDGRVLVDPCLGPGTGVALTGEVRSGASAVAELAPHGIDRWDHVIRAAGRPVNRYVTLSRDLGPREVRAFLEVSVTHSGVPADRRYLRQATSDGVVVVADHERGPRLRRWVRAGDGWRLAEERLGRYEQLVAERGA